MDKIKLLEEVDVVDPPLTNITVETLLSISRYIDRDQALEQVNRITEKLIAETGSGWNLSDADLSGANLEGFNLKRSTLNRAKLHSANLSNCNLSYSTIICPGMERTNLSGANFNGANLHALSAQVCNFDSANLQGVVDVTGALFHGCSMRNLIAGDANFSGSSFYQCNMENASFAFSNLQRCTFNESVLSGLDASGALVASVTITKSQLDNVVFDRATGEGLVLQRSCGCVGLSLQSANLPFLRMYLVKGESLNGRDLRAPHADISECTIAALDCSNADLSGARLNASNFSGACLKYAKLSGASIVSSCLPGVDMYGAMCESLVSTESTFNDSNMSLLKGRYVVFRDCDLTGVNLSGAYLYRSMFSGDPPKGMSLRKGNLSGSNLIQSFITADLSDSNLQGANLTYARLNQSILRGADLSGASTFEASFLKADVTNANLKGMSAPVFLDHCIGASESLEALGDEPKALLLKDFIDKLKDLIQDCKSSST